MEEKDSDFSLLKLLASQWAILGLLLILAMGLSLRLEALTDRYTQHPEGFDGSLEFKIYAENLLDYTLEGNKFPPKTRGHQPTLPLILTAVFGLFGRSTWDSWAA